MAGKKQKWYVVWVGANPGIYDNWADAKAQITGFPKARYKSFSSVSEAQKAFRSAPSMYMSKSSKSEKSNKTVRNISHEMIVNPSLSVDAACSGNPGLMEYQGVRTSDSMQLFHMGPFEEGTNNVGEFLALVHGLAYLKKIEKPQIPIYSDSKIAIGWVLKKKCNTKLKKSKKNENLFELIRRGEKWLKENTFKTPILKWETKSWGEIPADFGRK